MAMIITMMIMLIDDESGSSGCDKCLSLPIHPSMHSYIYIMHQLHSSRLPVPAVINILSTRHLILSTYSLYIDRSKPVTPLAVAVMHYSTVLLRKVVTEWHQLLRYVHLVGTEVRALYNNFVVKYVFIDIVLGIMILMMLVMILYKIY